MGKAEANRGLVSRAAWTAGNHSVGLVARYLYHVRLNQLSLSEDAARKAALPHMSHSNTVLVRDVSGHLPR